MTYENVENKASHQTVESKNKIQSKTPKIGLMLWALNNSDYEMTNVAYSKLTNLIN